MLNRLLTSNFKRVPLLWINFNLRKYQKNGPKNSCDCYMHPALQGDEHITETLKGLCDYIRENYIMEDLV